MRSSERLLTGVVVSKDPQAKFVIMTVKHSPAIRVPLRRIVGTGQRNVELPTLAICTLNFDGEHLRKLISKFQDSAIPLPEFHLNLRLNWFQPSIAGCRFSAV